MAKGNRSGIRVQAADLPIIISMITRGDRHHDIAAWFGLNQGRIKDAQDGKYGPPKIVMGLQLPPKGPPGIKGRHLREAVNFALTELNKGNLQEGIAKIETAIKDYDTDEI